MNGQGMNGLGMVLVISGPSGVGKDTVWKTASPCLPTFQRAVTCTTRERRPGEVEGVNYHYVSAAQFDRMIRDDELVEWAEVHGNRYGVPKSSIFVRVDAGNDVVCVIDVQGALKVRALFANSLLVFITPPPGREAQVLQERIEGRSAVDQDEMTRRLNTAVWELGQVGHYDFQIVNDDLNRAAHELCEVILRAKANRAGGPGEAAA